MTHSTAKILRETCDKHIIKISDDDIGILSRAIDGDTKAVIERQGLMVSELHDRLETARAAIIQECAHAAFEAYGSITSAQYVMEGPAGLAKRMIGAIKGLAGGHR
jgi:hypothetical protein